MTTLSKPHFWQRKHQRAARDLRAERIKAIIVVALFAAIVALVLWFGGSGGGVDDLPPDLWMMP